ncbi:MAG: Gfo/Idh/MocA family oxidoreductase [Candidatus Firestonebacteria bacterium]
MEKVGIIGCGKMGFKHYECFRRINGVKIQGLFDLDKNKCGDFRGAKTYENTSDLIKDCDIVDICTPTHSHKDLILESIKQKKHVFVEKPLCRTMEEANEILKEAKKRKSKIMVGHILRYYNQYSAIKKLIDSKAAGTPAVVRITRLNNFRRGANNWFSSLEKSGGVILDLMIHDIDFLMWCFGKVERVYAMNLMSKNAGFQNTDYALAVIRFKKGVIAHLEASWAHPGGFRTSVEVAGDKGLINYDSRTPSSLSVEYAGGKSFKDNPVDDNATLVELKDFIEYVRSGNMPKLTIEEAYGSLEVALAALESAKTGQVVTLK